MGALVGPLLGALVVGALAGALVARWWWARCTLVGASVALQSAFITDALQQPLSFFSLLFLARIIGLIDRYLQQRCSCRSVDDMPQLQEAAAGLEPAKPARFAQLCTYSAWWWRMGDEQSYSWP